MSQFGTKLIFTYVYWRRLWANFSYSWWISTWRGAWGWSTSVVWSGARVTITWGLRRPDVSVESGWRQRRLWPLRIVVAAATRASTTKIADHWRAWQLSSPIISATIDQSQHLASFLHPPRPLFIKMMMHQIRKSNQGLAKSVSDKLLGSYLLL